MGTAWSSAERVEWSHPFSGLHSCDRGCTTAAAQWTSSDFSLAETSSNQTQALGKALGIRRAPLSHYPCFRQWSGSRGQLLLFLCKAEIALGTGWPLSWIYHFHLISDVCWNHPTLLVIESKLISLPKKKKGNIGHNVTSPPRVRCSVSTRARQQANS